MKLDFLQQLGGDARRGASQTWQVSGETDRLTDVMLSAPAHLRPVACCAATRASLAAGFVTDTAVALAQHGQLRATLERLGVRCHVLPARPDLPDLCFTRDSVVTTPWGPVILNLAEPHRRPEADHAARYLDAIGAVPILRITDGTIEGGDVCVARDGLLIIGQSGERTDAAGVAGLSALFERHGWDVLVCPFDPEHLHLDTIFCMLDAHRALGCIEFLPPDFLTALADRGIAVLAAEGTEARSLGCNILSLDGRTILIGADQPRLHGVLDDAGFTVVPLAIDQFSACGGGLHCLTMPLARVRAG